MASVAEVVLVAHPSRWEALARVLGPLAGEGVALRWASVDAIEGVRGGEGVAAMQVSDLCVLDGESLSSEAERRRVLGSLARAPGVATVLYVSSRLPSDAELDDARVWADDLVYPGWAYAERVRCRVRALALAPSRRASAARRLAAARGDGRGVPLRVLPGGKAEGREPAASFEALRPPASQALVQDAFRQGRRVEAAHIRSEAERILARVLGEVTAAEASVSAETLADLEETFGGSVTPLAAARFGGARSAVLALRSELTAYLRDEQASIERHQVRCAVEEG